MEAGKRRVFPNGGDFDIEAATAAAAENGVELRLGLSTNGRFGPDPAPKRLKRSASVSGPLLPSYFLSDDAATDYKEARGNSAPPARAVMSVATETGVGETQTRLKSSEARRQRIEKMKTGRSVKFNDVEGSSGGKTPERNGGASSPQRSAGGSSDLHNLPSEDATPDSTNPVEAEGVKNGDVKKALVEMPYVSTVGNGPNGLKTEGFLYRYKSVDDLKIVCVCHGQFWTPAEFVKHGGGDEVAVAYPLKHIVMIRLPIP